jgi:hypothetical protein
MIAMEIRAVAYGPTVASQSQAQIDVFLVHEECVIEDFDPSNHHILESASTAKHQRTA